MTVQYIRSITERYEKLGYEPYLWFHADEPPPWAALKKPLAKSRLGVLSTAGAYVAGQVAYFYKDDTSTRKIPKATPVERMRFSHITENYLADARRDPNCVLPLAPLRQLEAEGVIGEVADELISCMGGIYSKRRVACELAPALAQIYRSQGVDAALLIPL